MKHGGGLAKRGLLSAQQHQNTLLSITRSLDSTQVRARNTTNDMSAISPQYGVRHHNSQSNTR